VDYLCARLTLPEGYKTWNVTDGKTEVLGQKLVPAEKVESEVVFRRVRKIAKRGY
jgi:hypothetical protein